MSDVSSILRQKGSHVLSVGPSATVLDAALLMNEHRVGAVVVVERGRLAGMFTERDVLRRVVAERRDPAGVRVREVMTDDVTVCEPGTDADDARCLFKERRIRHLPVVDDDGRVCGMISIGDLNAWELDGQECKIRALEAYLYGAT